MEKRLSGIFWLAFIFTLSTESALARVSVGVGAEGFYSGLSTTDSYGAKGSVASGVSFRIGPELAWRMGNRWRLVLASAFQTKRYTPPAGVSLNKEKFQSVGGNAELGFAASPRLWLRAGASYQKETLLVLSDRTAFTLSDRYATAVHFTPLYQIIQSAKFVTGLFLDLIWILPSEGNPRINSGLGYGGGLELKTSPQSHSRFVADYVARKMKITGGEEASTELRIRWVLHWGSPQK